MAREAMLARAFVRLADTLVSDFDIVDFLHGLSTDSVEILRAAAAGVMLADGRGGLRLIASSEERMRLLELFELQGAEGPCLDAFSSGRAVQAKRGRQPRPLASFRAARGRSRLPADVRGAAAGPHRRHRRPERVPRQRRAVQRRRDGNSAGHGGEWQRSR